MEFINLSEITKTNGQENIQSSDDVQQDIVTLFSNVQITETIPVVQEVDLTPDDEDDHDENDDENDENDENENDDEHDDDDCESVDEPDDGQYTLLGLRTEDYIGEGCSGDYVYTPKTFTRTILYCKRAGSRVQITLTITEGMCMSGYTNASWAQLEISHESFSRRAFTYVPDDSNAKFNLSDPSKYFFFSEYGYDDYYPRGRYEINFEHFTQV